MTQIAYSLCAFFILSGIAVWILKPWNDRTCKWIVLGLEFAGVMIGFAGIVIGITGAFTKPPTNHGSTLTLVRTPEPPPLLVPSLCTLIELKNTMRMYASNPDSLVLLLQQKESCWSSWIGQSNSQLDSGIACLGMGLYREALAHLDRYQPRPTQNGAAAEEEVDRYRLLARTLLGRQQKATALAPPRGIDTTGNLRGVERHANLNNQLGHYEEAIESYDRLLALNPSDDATLYNKGVALMGLDRFEEALKVFDLALSFNRHNYDAQFNKGAILRDLNRMTAAIYAFDACTKMDPTQFRGHFNLGRCLSEQNAHESAVRAFNAALALEPKSTAALGYKGVVLARLNLHEYAIDAFRSALAIKPDLWDVLDNMGLSLSAIGKHQEALDAFNASLQIRNDPIVLRNKGNCLKAMRRFNEAVSVFNAQLILAPDDALTLFCLARVYADLRNKQSMLDNLQAAIRYRDDFKKMAVNDRSFAAYSSDPDFLRTVADGSRTE
jgi:tetratricopeptide (TPR) repeat protein